MTKIRFHNEVNLDYIEVNGKDFKEYNNILRHKAQPIDFGPKSILTASQYDIVYVEENFTSFHKVFRLDFEGYKVYAETQIASRMFRRDQFELTDT